MKNSVKALKFEELKSLDLGECETVGDIVDAMRYCAFGARMLGEVAHTIRGMVTAGDKPVLIYDGIGDSPLGSLLQKFVSNKWCRRILSPSQYAKSKNGAESAIVVGVFSERDAEAIYARPGRAVFINQFDMARPGQIRDGYFPDAVFADPRYVMPAIYAALAEWIDGERSSVGEFVSTLPPYG